MVYFRVVSLDFLLAINSSTRLFHHIHVSDQTAASGPDITPRSSTPACVSSAHRCVMNSPPLATASRCSRASASSHGAMYNTISAQKSESTFHRSAGPWISSISFLCPEIREPLEACHLIGHRCREMASQTANQQPCHFSCSTTTACWLPGVSLDCCVFLYILRV